MRVELTGSGAARAAGTGDHHGKANLRSDVGAGAGGGRAIALMPCRGGTRAEGLGQIGWTFPLAPPGMEDIWFYGQTKVKRMPGRGIAAAHGEGTLTV